jgi:hypothetical protein
MKNGPVTAMPFGGSQVELGHSRNPGPLRLSAARLGLPSGMMIPGGPADLIGVHGLARICSPSDGARACFSVARERRANPDKPLCRHAPRT